MSLASEFLNQPPERRREAFAQAAVTKGIDAAIVEKDFWVSWILGILFSNPEWGPHFIFKGGTSLSKVYQVIDRFSEDVDLGMTPRSLGRTEEEFETLQSRTSRDKVIAEMQRACGDVLRTRIVPSLEQSIQSVLGAPQIGDHWLHFEFDERAGGPVVYFRYPSEFPTGLDYIRRVVKLEFGSLPDQLPLGNHPVRPWLGDVFPALFQNWHCQVKVLELKRSFWEKATILHAEFHRPETSEMPIRYARHYSDFARLLKSEHGETFLNDTEMCRRVVEWKSRFFSSNWARFDLACRGTFRLVPPQVRLRNLEKDYVDMHPMFLGEPLAFNEMIDILNMAQIQLNAT